MATSTAGYRGRNWTDRLSALASLLLCGLIGVMIEESSNGSPVIFLERDSR